MSRPLTPTLLAVLLSCALVPAARASDEAMMLSLQQQRQQMPAEFREHLFGTPVSVRVELDGRYLGDAQVLLFEDNRVQLLSFGDSYDSSLSQAERERWANHLSQPTALGVQRDSAQGLRAAHYNLAESQLSLLSVEGQRAGTSGRYMLQPESGSTGLILRNQLTYSGGQQQGNTLRYAADLQGSLGQWSTVGSYQYFNAEGASAANGHYLSALYAQREMHDHFLRVGYFLPSFQGVTRQPRAPGTQNYTTIGVMAGSSDALLADVGGVSVYPVYVTASRGGVVEIYRDGALISTQTVVPGMQEINTRRLPGGIYDVELRVVEDGHVTSTETATIHKPSAWRDPTRRWRYSVFAGQQQGLLDSGNDPEQGKLSAGAVVNYLVHPRAVAGLSVQQVGDRRAAGASLDWQASDRFNLYTNLYDSTDAGRGISAQGMFRYTGGTLTLGHTRNWVEERQRLVSNNGQPRWETLGGWQDSSSLSWSHRFGDRDNASLRLAHNNGFNAGLGVDASYWRQQPLFGTDASWRVSVYDRPGSAYTRQRRQRGIDFTLTLALGQEGRRYNAGLGSRTGSGGNRDLYANAGVQQQIDTAWLKSVNANLDVDRSGVSLGAGAVFDQQQLHGDVYAQRSAETGLVSSTVNLESTVALGGGKLALLGRTQASSAHTGMIVDVSSDFPEAQLRADDSHGGGVTLKPGRNFVPINAYKAGHVQFDFSGRNVPAATIQPAAVSYHLNKGGVTHAQINVLRTFTVMGQVLDDQGNGARGVHVINHAGRSVSQDEGFFTLELSAREPIVELRYPDQRGCTLSLDENRYPREGDVLMVGNLQCPASVAGN
ncbi:TcfC E-set like domain-containing protein [Stenotrophomonas indicatrix]|uniref:TcfC E-set like domain-containing protein n=1 Tax=Stenotrophomonas indicatrix TaxID=2045451 RepID=UPI0030092E98